MPHEHKDDRAGFMSFTLCPRCMGWNLGLWLLVSGLSFFFADYFVLFFLVGVLLTRI